MNQRYSNIVWYPMSRGSQRKSKGVEIGWRRAERQTGTPRYIIGGNLYQNAEVSRIKIHPKIWNITLKQQTKTQSRISPTCKVQAKTYSGPMGKMGLKTNNLLAALVGLLGFFCCGDGLAFLLVLLLFGTSLERFTLTSCPADNGFTWQEVINGCSWSVPLTSCLIKWCQQGRNWGEIIVTKAQIAVNTWRLLSFPHSIHN